MLWVELYLLPNIICGHPNAPVPGQVTLFGDGVFFFFFFLSFVFLGLYLWHREVPRLGVE